MTFAILNVSAILTAALSAFALGALWYAPFVFGAVWKRANGFTADPPPRATIFLLTFFFNLVMAVNLAIFLNSPKTTTAFGAAAGFAAGLGWAAMGLAIVALFERRPWSYILVNGGYLTVALTLMGTILGAWR
jgi:hypothetical protein